MKNQSNQSKIEINFVGCVPMMTVTHKGRFLCRSALRRYCKSVLAKKDFKGTTYERELFDESVVVINWEKVA